MMGHTDRHFRTLLRLMDVHHLAYTEMRTANALLHGPGERLLAFHPCWEGPVVAQLGGGQPEALYTATAMVREAGYAGVNLNCGCPSPRVQKGAFGAALMADSERVRACLIAMAEGFGAPVSLKCRLGIEDTFGFEFLHAFLEATTGEHCRHVVIHARSCWLQGLSPAQNRSIPPLDYETVRRIKRHYGPRLHITLNGGVTSAEHALALLKDHDGVMVGRAAVRNPAIIPAIAKSQGLPIAHDYWQAYQGYMRTQEDQAPLRALLAPLIPMIRNTPGSRVLRQRLSEATSLDQALAILNDARERAAA